MSFGNVRMLDMPDSFSKKELCSWLCIVSRTLASKQRLITPPSLEAMELAIQSLLFETVISAHHEISSSLCLRFMGLHCRVFNSFWVSKPLTQPPEGFCSDSLLSATLSNPCHPWHDTWNIYQAICFLLPVLILPEGLGRKDNPCWLMCVSVSLDTEGKKTNKQQNNNNMLIETIFDRSDDILWNNVILYFHSHVGLGT